MKQTVNRWMMPMCTVLMAGAALCAALLSGCGGDSGGSEADTRVSDSSGATIDCSQPYPYPEATTYANDTDEQRRARHAKERAYEAACGTGGGGSSSGSGRVPYFTPGPGQMISPRYNP